jgi:TonB family protein
MTGRSAVFLLSYLLLFMTSSGLAAGVGGPNQVASAPPSVDEATQHNAAGLTKARNRDFDGAIAEFSEAIRRDPTFAEAFRNRALAERNKGNLDDALRDLSQAISLNPRYTAALYDRGLVYGRKRDFERAIEDYSHVLAIDPTNADAYDNRGLAKTDKGDVDDGIADLTTAITLAPQSARAYNNRGYAKTKKQEYAAAIADCDQAIRLDPKDAHAYDTRGDAKVGLKDPVGAIADYTTAINLGLKRADTFYARGRAKFGQGDQAGAIDDFTQTIGLNPGHVGAYTDRCQAHRANGAFDDAVADCTQAIKLNPKYAHAFLERGRARLQKGDLDAAAQDLSEAINLNPEHAPASYERCNVEVRQGALDRAISDCNEAIALDSSLAVAYFARAVALAKRGDTTEANRDYVRAHELDPKLEIPRTFVAGTGSAVGSATPGSVANGVYRAGGGVTLPKLTREVKPQYTADALGAKIQGTVLVECVVRPDGSVGDIQIVRSLDPVYGLDSEAVKAAKQWMFEPGTKDGKPVPVLITIELAFRIGDAPAVAAPLALPAAFGAVPRANPASPDDQWREQVFDQTTVRTHVRYPKGWATTTGIADDVILLQNTKEPFGVVLLKPQPASVVMEQAVPQSALQGFADVVAKATGRSTTAFGQTRANGRLWFWLHFDQLSPATNEASSSSPFGYARRLVDATRTWFFVTTAARQDYIVMFFVSRISNTSVDELNRVTSLAGPVFATMLDSLTFESPDSGAVSFDAIKLNPEQTPPSAALHNPVQDLNAGQSFGPEIQFDTKGVEFGPWIRRFIRQVKQNWLIPYASMNEKGHVVITFDVHKNGTITDVSIATPSTVAVFNDSARASVLASSPTQPLPAEYPAAEAHFTVTFYYNESQPAPGHATTTSSAPAADHAAASLLAMTASNVEQRLGRPTQVDGLRWTYTMAAGALLVYFNDAHVVIDVQPRDFDLTLVKK